MKNPLIKESDLSKVYAMYNNNTVTDQSFKIYCANLVENARDPNPDIVRQLREGNTPRAKALMMTNNFAFKGQGFGVL